MSQKRLPALFRHPAAAAARALTSRAGLLTCLGLGLLVRLAATRHAYFADDESLFWATGVSIARLEAFPLVGPPISGSPAGLPGPLYYWVCALPALVSSHPLVGSAFYALFSVVGVGLFADVLRRVWGRRPAAVFLVVAVASPWMVPYADRIWAGNLFFGLCAVVVWLTLRLVQRPRARGPSFALGALAVALPQLHLSTAHLVLAALVLAAVYRAKPAWRFLFAGALLGAALYAPYLVHELRTDFSNTRAILHHAPGAAPRSARALGSLWAFFLGLGTTDISYQFARGYWYGFDHLTWWEGPGRAAMAQVYAEAGAAPLLWTAHLGSWLVQAFGVVAVAARAVKKRRLDFLTLLFALALLDILALFLASGKAGYAHYVTILAPVAYLPLSLGLALLASVRRLAPVVAAWLLVFVTASGLVLAAWYRGLEGTAPDQLAIVEAVQARRPGGEPFTLYAGSQWIFHNAYARLSETYLKKPWTPVGGAPQQYLVMQRRQWDQAPPPGWTALLLEPHLVLATPAAPPPAPGR